MAVVLTSLNNPLVKNVLRLIAKPAARKEENLVVIEGYRETMLAMAAGFRLAEVIICREILAPGSPVELPPDTKITEVSAQVYNRLAYRENSGGILALAEPRRLTFGDLKYGSRPLFLVLETVEKPGNLGAVLRTADAAGIDGVIICDPQTDIYNPNVIRSSVGCIFTVPVVTATSEEAIYWMETSGITTFGTALTATEFYHETDFTPPSAIIMGSEANGLSDQWLTQADHLVKVPMRGKIDSMNVSVTAAIVVFEAMRQRGFKP